jgi:hypothetical protein
VDLVVGASLHRLAEIPAVKRFAVPHGAGYNKLWPEWARPVMDGKRPVYGLDSVSLLDNRGRPVLDALMLPHPEHLVTLARQCPEVLDTAVVAGDPCFDRLVGCVEQRDRYRLLELSEPREPAAWPPVGAPRLVQDERQPWTTTP